TVGIMMPCHSSVNFTTDLEDANALAEQFGIECRVVDISKCKDAVLEAVGSATQVSKAGDTNIAPRLRMITLYAVAASESRLVAGTGNRSEGYMGYYTKWGDGAHDFNPVSDLTATEIFEFLRYLGAPKHIIEKAPSAGLFEGQTDEKEMGVTYDAIDKYLMTGKATEHDREIIERYHSRSLHKLEIKRFSK
ncbi:MAG TPA: NAD(+) synthase, partial [Bacillota bacterium]|nr:NAD(+) synthase [Bacillota bacterium]